MSDNEAYLLLSLFLIPLGLLVKFLRPKREVLAVWSENAGKTVLHVGYRVEYQKSMGREDLDRILAEVRAE